MPFKFNFLEICFVDYFIRSAWHAILVRVSLHATQQDWFFVYIVKQKHNCPISWTAEDKLRFHSANRFHCNLNMFTPVDNCQIH